MNLANKLSFFRIILAPVFFVIYLLPHFFPSLFVNGAAWTVPVIWIIAIVSEITDYFDGFAARKLNLTSDFGKFLDPFADTLTQITFFLCFIIEGIFPAGILAAFLFLLVVYREFAIMFLRNLMAKKGIAMGARMGGKIKTVSYISSGAIALLASSLERLDICKSILPYIKICALVGFAISVIIAIISFFDYLIIYKKTADVNVQ
ncbi:CDP-diacylglycerol--glycerol-3-phosphate 3-phosphatidyltransferase [Treponema sp. R8-4-B8]